MKQVAVIGGGLVGGLWSLFLARRGYRVDLYEKRPDPRHAEQAEGRSINLALSDRGWKALRQVGLAEQVEQMVVPMEGRMLHEVSGETHLQAYSREGRCIYAVSRQGLNSLLLDAAEQAGVTMAFETACRDIDPEQGSLVLEPGGARHHYDLIFGTDGLPSVVRGSLQPLQGFSEKIDTLDYGYKELAIPHNEQLYTHALHIWPRRHFMLIALPNADGSFTGTLFLPFKGTPGFGQLQTPEQITNFFETHFPDALALLPDLVEQFRAHPTGKLSTVYCYPWAHGNKVLLLGDAAHAIVPFYGQGMNAGFEDCSMLNALLDEHSDDWSRVMPAFQELRKPDVDAIAEMAMENFVEMRDHVADVQFQLRKRIEANIAEQFPDYWMPRYSMVTFSDQRYSEVLQQSRRQEAIMDRLMQMEGIEAKGLQKPLPEEVVDEVKRSRRDA